MEAGFSVRLGHSEEHVFGKEAVVFSSAIPPHNPELLAARHLKIPTMPRLIALSRLLVQRKVVAVCGTHGKTTTTAWIAHLLQPWEVGFYVGASIKGLPRAQWGVSPWFVAEVDESDGLFLELPPEVVVLTNVDQDHLSSYGGFSQLKDSFEVYVSKAKVAVACADDRYALEVSRVNRRRLIYGLSAGATLRAENIHMGTEGTEFLVRLHGKRVGEALVPTFGLHNIRNALAALAAAHVMGVPLRKVLDRLPSVPLPARRLEVVEENGYVLVDDYAHHPREIAAGIAAIRSRWPGRRLLALFQPHRFSRTALLYEELGKTLAATDLAVVTEIYPAFETPIPRISGRLVAQAVEKFGGRALFVVDVRRSADAVMELASPGDVVVCFGAGDIWRHFRRIPEML